MNLLNKTLNVRMQAWKTTCCKILSTQYANKMAKFINGENQDRVYFRGVVAGSIVTGSGASGVWTTLFPFLIWELVIHVCSSSGNHQPAS